MQALGRALVLAGLLVVLALPAAAHADTTRAVLTWDTDDTDVDLHAWDEDGNHAYYGDQEAIPGAQLTTDILYGFGPEELFEYDESTGRTLTFGVCYFASNRSDEVVPETVATIQVTDPDGTRRTLKRRLRAERDAFLLGTSPAGARGFTPEPGWCRDNPVVGSPQDDGGVATPDEQPFEGCARTRRRIGVVEVCADTISGEGSRYRLAGDVRLNGAVTVSTPVSLDTDENTITSDGVAELGLRRAGTTHPVAAGQLLVRTAGTRDGISGRDGLAVLELAAPQPRPLRVAGLEVTPSSLTGGRLQLLLDRRDGGGVVMASHVALPLGGHHASIEAVAVGAHAASRVPFRVLGGTATFGEVPIGTTGWKFSGLSIAYSEADDRWTVRGGFATPAFGLDVDGSVVGGQLDAIGLTLHRDVPFGQSGFILSSAGGSVAGLVQPPLKVALTASGRWGSVPGVRDVAIVHLKEVRLEVDLSGRIALSGAVTFITRDGSPVNGTMQLLGAMSPFESTGSLGASLKFHWVDMQASTRLRMNANAFTALGSATGELRGLRLGSGRAVLSDKGAGGFGEVCALPGRRLCTSIGFGMAWKDWPGLPQVIGADIDRYVTARAARSGARTITVEPGRPLLAVDAIGTTGVPVIDLRAPSGSRYTTARARRRMTVVTDPVQRYAGLTVLAPEPGRWTVRVRGGAGPTRVVAQSVRRVQRVTPRALRPRTSRRRPLRTRSKAVALRWTSRGLGRGVRVDVHVSQSPSAVGRLVTAGRSARGSYRLRRSALARGVNYVHLVVRSRGIAVDQARFRQAVWVR